MEIIGHQASPCFCSSCGGHWFVYYYCLNDDGSYSICDSSGDHDDIEKSSIPSDQELRESWIDYYKYVKRTGKDPLGEFYRYHRITKKWQAKARNWIGAHKHGLMITGVRRRGRGPWRHIKHAPNEVLQYMLANERNCIDDIYTLEELLDVCDGARRKSPLEVWVDFEVIEEIPVSGKTLKKMAQEQIQSLSETLQ